MCNFAMRRGKAVFLAAAVCVMAVCPQLMAEDGEPKAGEVEALKNWEWIYDNKEYIFGFERKAERFFEEYTTPQLFHWVCLVDHDLAMEIYDKSVAELNSREWEKSGSVSVTWTMDVRMEPKPEAKRIGQILIRLLLGRRETDVYVPWLRAVFVPEDGGSPVDFEPDFTDLDFGYSGYFHHTFLKREGNWFKLPKNPLPEPGWVNLSVLCRYPRMLAIVEWGAYTFREEIILILGIDHSGITYRPLGPDEDPCCGGVLVGPPTETFRMPAHELYDEDGHLRLKYACPRGC